MLCIKSGVHVRIAGTNQLSRLLASVATHALSKVQSSTTECDIQRLHTKALTECE